MNIKTEGLARVRRLIATGRAKQIREAADVSLREIAEDVGVSITCIWRWEQRTPNGNARKPTGPAALRYLRVLERLEAQLDAIETAN